MSKALNLFNKLSGLQKSFLIENIEPTLEELLTTLDNLTNNPPPEFTGDKESSAKVDADNVWFDYQKRVSALRNQIAKIRRKEREAPSKETKANIGKLVDKSELSATDTSKGAGKKATPGQLSYLAMKIATAKGALAAEKLAGDAKVDALKLKLQNPNLSKLERTNIQNSISDQILANQKEEDKRQADITRAQDSLEGKTTSEKFVTTKNLTELNPLVVAEKPEDSVGSVLDFSQMMRAAESKGSEGGTSSKFITLTTTINKLNELAKYLFSNLHTSKIAAKQDPHQKDRNVKKIFKDFEAGNIETDSDLIKIFWLYFAGESALETAKEKPGFIAALTKLEATKKQPITKPISKITSLSDMFNTESVKAAMDYYKAELGSVPGTLDSIVAGSKTILDAPDDLYTNDTTSSLENIADTFYYAIINTFGTPKDKIKLLKQKGSKTGLGAGFFTREAKDFINKEEIKLSDRVVAGKALPSKSGKYGSQEIEHFGPSGWGMQMLRAMSDKKAVGGISTAGEASDKLIQNSVASNIEQGFSLTGGDSLAAMQALCSNPDTTTVGGLYSVLSRSFSSVLKDKDSILTAFGNGEKYNLYSTVFSKTEAAFNSILASLTLLRQSDIKALASVFKVAYNKPEVTKRDITVDKDSEEGKKLLSFSNLVLNKIEEKKSEILASRPENKTELIAKEGEVTERDTISNASKSTASSTNIQGLTKTLEVAEKSLAAAISTSELNVKKLSGLLFSKNLESVVDYIDNKEDVLNTIDTLLNASEDYTKLDAWHEELRKPLLALSKHLNNSDVKSNKDLFELLTNLTTPFRAELENVNKIKTLKANLANTDKAVEKAIEKHKEKVGFLGQDGEEAASAEGGKIADKAFISTQSIVPGSSFSGTVKTKRKSDLDAIFLANLKSLEGNASNFYNNIKDVITDLDLVSKISLKNSQDLSTDSEGLLDALTQLVGNFKTNLSTDIDSASLENDLFLHDLVNAGELSSVHGEYGTKSETGVGIQNTRDKIKQHSDFKFLLDSLNQAKDNGSILWPKKVINAPVIGMGKSSLGLKSASLLNILSGLKNFDSITSFDLSMNKSNRDILSSVLNTNNYPTIFTLSPSTTLIMKLYFVAKIKLAVDKAKVLEEFSGNFIDVKVKLDSDSEITNKVKESINGMYEKFETSVLSELTKDFGAGGTLDTELSSGFMHLRGIIEDLGTVAIVSEDRLKVIPVSLEHTSDEDIHQLVLNLGSKMFFDFKAAPPKNGLSTAYSNFLLYFSETNTGIKALSDCIAIIKTGINFYCGLAALKAISEKDLYDPITKEFDSVALDDRIKEYNNIPEYAAFTERFVTTLDKETQVKTTTQVSNRASMQGISNLNNAFLSAFLKSFAWDSINNSLVGINIEKAGEGDDIAEKIASHKSNEVIEKTLPVFVKGLFKLGAKSSIDTSALLSKIASRKKQLASQGFDETQINADETLVGLQTSLDSAQAMFGSEEAEAQIKKIEKSNEKQISKLETHNTISKPFNVVKTTVNSQGILGVELNIQQPPKYINVTKEVAQGFEEGMTKSGKTGGIDAGTKSSQAIGQLGENLRGYSEGLTETCEILSALYPDKTEEITAYAKSVSESYPKVKLAISVLGKNAYDTEVQRLALESLNQMNPMPVPDILLLKNPAKAIQDAKESFTESVVDDTTGETSEGVFYKYSKFADAAASDIINKTATISSIVDSINNILKSKKFAGAELESPQPSIQPKKSNITGETEDTFIQNFFTPQVSEEAAKNLLDKVIIPQYGVLPKKDERISQHAQIKGELATLQATIAGKVKLADNLRLDIAKETEKSAKDKLVSELGTIQYDIDISNKKLLALKNKSQSIDIEEPKILTPLKKLTQSASSSLMRYKSNIKNFSRDINKERLSNLELNSLITKLQLVIQFVTRLVASSGGYTGADNILKSLKDINTEATNIKLHENVNRDVAKLAVASFNLLLENERQTYYKYSNTPRDMALKAQNDIIAELEPINNTISSIKTQLTEKDLPAETAAKLNNELLLAQQTAKDLTTKLTAAREAVIAEKASNTDQDYIVGMAKLMNDDGADTVDDFEIRVLNHDGTSEEVSIVKRSIVDATISKISKSKFFAPVRNVMSSSIKLLMSADLDDDNRQKEIVLKITDFYSIKKVAERDISYIKAYLGLNDE